MREHIIFLIFLSKSVNKNKICVNKNSIRINRIDVLLTIAYYNEDIRSSKRKMGL